MRETAESYEKKMTKTPVAKLILSLGLPTTIATLITNIYNLADTYFVGTLGKSAQGAIGIVFTLQAIIQAFAFMLGHGSGTYVARDLARKDPENANKYISTAFFVGGIIGILLLVFGIIFIDPFMKLLGSTDTILPYSRTYGMLILISAPFMIWSLILNNNLRYEGKAFYSMLGLGTGAILNILGDYIMITVCGWGVFGAGLSTCISQVVSFVLLLIFYFRMSQTRLGFKYISKQGRTYYEIVTNGMPSLIRQGLTSVGGGILNTVAGAYGDQAIAAMSIVNRFSNFIMCVGLGVGQGFQPVSSYNYTAKRYKRVKKGLIFTICFGTGVVAILATIGLIIPDKIIEIFQTDPEVIEIGTFALRIASIGAIFQPITIALNMLYQSIRRSYTASFLAMLRSGLVFIPVLLIFSNTMGLTGIQIAQPVADVICSIISIPFLVSFMVKKFDDEITDENITQM